MVDLSQVWKGIRSRVKFREDAFKAPTIRRDKRQPWERPEGRKARLPLKIGRFDLDKERPRLGEIIQIKFEPRLTKIPTEDLKIAAIRLKEEIPKLRLRENAFKTPTIKRDIIALDLAKGATKSVATAASMTFQAVGKATGAEYATRKVGEKVMGFGEEQLREEVEPAYVEKIRTETNFYGRQEQAKKMASEFEGIEEFSVQRQKQFQEAVEELQSPKADYEIRLREAKEQGFKVDTKTVNGEEQITISDPRVSEKYSTWKTKWRGEGFEISEEKEKTDGDVQSIFSIKDIKTEKKIEEFEKAGLTDTWLKEITKEKRISLAGGPALFYTKTFGKSAVIGAAAAAIPPYAAYLGGTFISETALAPAETLQQVIKSPGESAVSLAGFLIGMGGVKFAKFKLTQPKLKNIKAIGKIEKIPIGKGVMQISQIVKATFKKGKKTFTKSYKAKGSAIRTKEGYSFSNMRIYDYNAKTGQMGKPLGEAKAFTISRLSEIKTIARGTIKTEMGKIHVFEKVKPKEGKFYDYESIILSKKYVKRPGYERWFDRALNIIREKPKKTIKPYKTKAKLYKGTGRVEELQMKNFLSGKSERYLKTLPESHIKQLSKFEPMKLFDSSGRLISYGRTRIISGEPIPTHAFTRIVEPTPDISSIISGVKKVKTPKIKDIISDKQLASLYKDIKVKKGVKLELEPSISAGITESVIKTLQFTRPAVTKFKPTLSASEIISTGSAVVKREKEKEDGKQERLYLLAGLEDTKIKRKQFQGIIETQEQKAKIKQKQKAKQMKKVKQGLLISTAVAQPIKQDILQTIGGLQIQSQFQQQVTQPLQEQILIQEQVQTTPVEFSIPIGGRGFWMDIEKKRKIKKPKKKKKKKERMISYAPSLTGLLSGYVGKRPRKITGIKPRPGKKDYSKQVSKLLGGL